MAGTTTLSTAAQWLVDWVRGPVSDAGVAVSMDTALGYPPVLYAVRKISGHIGQLPLVLYREIDDGREKAESHPVSHLVKTRPNRYQTAVVFREQMMVHALLAGNGRAAIIRSQGMPTELIPLTPNTTFTCMIEGEKWHVVHVRDEDSIANNETLGGFRSMLREGAFYRIHDDDCLHIPGLGYNGIVGQSVVTLARDAIGLGIAGQSATSKAFANGSRPGIVIESPPNMFNDEKDASEFIQNFNEFHEGLDNIGRAALLREGMKIHAMPVSASDAQWIEQRRFQKQDIALIFGMETMPGEEDSVSYNSLEQKNRAYLTNCLSPWFVKWEQECDYKLLGLRSRNTHFFKFDTQELLRPDYESTVTSLSTAIRSMIMSPNEARRFLNMNPYEGGDVYVNPAIYNPEKDSQYGDGNESRSKQSEPEPTQASQNLTRQAVLASMESLLSVECRRVCDAAKSGETVKKLERFYDKWPERLSERICQIVKNKGLADAIANEHCEESQERILNVVSCVPPGGLSAAIAVEVGTWAARADRIADKIESSLIARIEK